MAYGPSDLVSDLLALIDKRWVSEQDILRLLAALPLAPGGQRIHCLRELQRIFRLLPLQVFSEEAQREHLLSICQLTMDQLIDDEEASLRGGQEE
ncbi:TyeA family type III secretion system gatekeeper subunit [Pseudomonas carassii]|uniref:TyeA family type III secretion system gatekeeper subunit n=1 Tax=Pseudomonas carassii TaxID=3115855 RepID=A0ABU7H944_9PSED|nr:TyeA family type III secretion system gatekeeper subunit [Pseudomonas sp. 137P]MEE1887842.1 TyeA family type III secretion system gatekeeper subunit [Pseudomonas sp. 137P]